MHANQSMLLYVPRSLFNKQEMDVSDIIEEAYAVDILLWGIVLWNYRMNITSWPFALNMTFCAYSIEYYMYIVMTLGLAA